MNNKILVNNIIMKLPKTDTVDFFKDKVVTYSIEKIHKRRLSSVYFVNINFSCSGTKKLCIKLVNCDKSNIKKMDIYKKKLVDEFNSHLSAYENFNSPTDFRIVKPICVFSDDLALITESFENSTTLESMIIKNIILGGEKNLIQLEKLMFSSGILLSQYHALRVEDMVSVNKEVETLKKYILVRLNLIYKYFNDNHKKYPSTKSVKLFNDIFSKIIVDDKNGKNLLTNIHGDFTPANVLFDGNTLALIDFSEVSAAPKYTDVGCFINYLDMLPLNKPIYSIKKIKKLKESFENGYNSENEINPLLVKLYKFRYLSTNMLTQIYEMRDSKLKSILMHHRIKRYMALLEKHSFF
jgi:hypothetical protein